MRNDQRRTIFTRWRSLKVHRRLSTNLRPACTSSFFPRLQLPSNKPAIPESLEMTRKVRTPTRSPTLENPTLWKHFARLRLRRTLVVLSIYSLHCNKVCCCFFSFSLSLSLFSETFRRRSIERLGWNLFGNRAPTGHKHTAFYKANRY